MNIIEAQLKAAKNLRDRVAGMTFAPPVARVYNPLTYAWEAFEEYVTRYGNAKKRVLFLGMNPGPWGMTQTGVPFGEVAAVREWLGISAPVGRPADGHPKYPVDGYACKRSEVSGRRLWGLFRQRYETPAAFFEEHFVINYCPLFFVESSVFAGGKEGARNLTPDKLPAAPRAALYKACDAHLRSLAEILCPSCLVGIGAFASTRAEEALKGMDIGIARVLHPSPASPKSNTDWGGEATRQMQAQGIW